MAYTPLDSAIAMNPQGLDALRALGSRGQSRDAMRGVTSQFEAYFTQMMLRSMRQTLSQDGPFDSQETRTFTEMFDQQLAQKISQGKGLGLADVMLAQIGKGVTDTSSKGAVTAPAGELRSVPDATETSAPVAAGSKPSDTGTRKDVAGQFVDRLWSHAVEAAKSLGVQPHVLVAQAALETGWGRHELKDAEGAASHNLFNIKAGSGWQGKTVQKDVTEFVSGKPVKSTETFRAYDSPAEAMADYASLLGNNPRYAGVLNQDAAGFVRGLRQGGFATDPAYGDKLMRVIEGGALRSALAG